MSSSPFKGLRRTPELHFLVNFQSAVFMLIRYLRSIEPATTSDEGEEQDPLDGLLARYPFLALYLGEIGHYMPNDLTWDEGAAWWQESIEDWERSRRSYLPLGALKSYGDIGFGRRMGVLCAGMVEEDARFGDLFDALQPGTRSRRATIEFIGHLILHVDPDAEDSPRRATQPLLDLGVLRLLEHDSAYAERPVKVPELLWEVLREGPDDALAKSRGTGIVYRSRYRVLPFKKLIFATDFLDKAKGVPRLLRDESERLLVVRGAGGSLRGPVIYAIARALRYNTLEVESVTAEKAGNQIIDANLRALIAPLALVTKSIAVMRMDPTPGETVSIPDLKGYQGLKALILGRVGGVDAAAVEHSVTLDLPRLQPAQRESYWRDALDDAAPDDLSDTVSRFMLPGGHIRSVAGSARAFAAIGQRQQVNDADLQAGHHNLNRQYLDALATALDPVGGWDGLITAHSVTAKLRELELRCRYREELPKHLGPAFGGTANQGVRVLFNGPSGTGKTLAARTLASVLGMDIYRVDLAAIVNKYIGETEKNLHQVLSRAEEMDVILLIDEGDSLLGKRTDVGSANDRYANLETNYLLQRLESHEGIVLVTTNAGDSIDTAFQRRMDVSVNFVAPQTDERVRIWRLHLPDNHQVSDEQLLEISRLGEFTGGQIRNAALLATLLGLEDQEQVSVTHLRAAVESEYRKAGAMSRVDPLEPEVVKASASTGNRALRSYVSQLRKRG